MLTPHSNAKFKNCSDLFSEHNTNTLSGYAREAYGRTKCGVETSFLLKDGSVVHSSDIVRCKDNIAWANENISGVKHSVIVGGSNAEVDSAYLVFPFTDKELAETWDYLEGEVNRVISEEKLD